MRCSVFAAIICVCSFLIIPVGTVPVSAAVLAIMLCGVVLPPFEAFCTTSVYIIMGAIGLPVFSFGSGGIGVLLGITGGYIWSYPLLSLTVSLFSSVKVKSKIKKYVASFFGCICGMAICYTCGTIQYMLVANVSFYAAMVVCVAPFLLIDLLKAFVAVGIGNTIKNKI